MRKNDVDWSREARPKITKAFRNLRKEFGFVARQNYWCCGSCAWAAIDTPKNAGKPVVFYNQQSNASFKNTGNVYLSFGRVVDEAHDEDTVLIGKQIYAALVKEGLPVDWDGTADKSIQVVTKE